MFKIGDKVVYPMHGAGIIDDIVQQEILGSTEDCFVVLLTGDLKLMVPVGNADLVGIRDISTLEDIKKVFQVLESEITEMSNNWNKRYRANMDRIKSGDIFEVADVVKNLMILDNKKGLSTGEKRLLNTAKQMLTSEIVLVVDKSEDEVIKKVDEIVNFEQEIE